MRMNPVWLLATAALAGCDSAPSTASVADAAPGGAIACGPAETPIYACDFGDAAVAVCADAGANTVAFSYGAPDAPLVLRRTPGEQGLMMDTAIGGGGGSQLSLAFTEGDLDYIAYSATQGSLHDNPGATHSGVAVYRGDEEIERRDCPDAAQALDQLAIPAEVPMQPDPDKSLWY